MSKVGIKLKLDLSKIDKSLLFQGKKGTYLDATVFVNLDQADQYDNNGMITQDSKKEDREAGKNGPILGNCKVFWKEGYAGNTPTSAPSNQQPATQNDNWDDFDSSNPF